MAMEEEMSKSNTNTTTVLLPQDILMDILSRLPANSLVSSFKLVCKAWRTLIQDSDFVKTHLNRQGGGGEGIYSNNSLICKTGNELFQLYPTFNFEGLDPPTESPTKLDFDWDLSSSSRLIGSCNGVICIKKASQDETIILLNPSTRKYKILLPKEWIDECPSQFKSHKPVAYGFGCCCCHNFTTTTIDDEYKVVRIACRYPPPYDDDDYKDPTFRFRIQVYSMSSNSWRNRRGIKDIPYLMSEQRPGIFVSGALHWVGYYSSDGRYGNLSLLLISFDIRDEDFGHIEMPPCDDTMDDMILMNMRGWLGIVYLYPTKDVDLEIWVMKEYGMKESWTKECVIRSSNVGPYRAVYAFGSSFKAGACFLKDDQILINQGYGRLALYDMNTKKIDWNFKMVDVSGKPSVDIVDYIETLVSLKSSLVP